MRDYREVASPAQADRDDPKSSDVIGQYHDGTLLVRQIKVAFYLKNRGYWIVRFRSR
jgi:hypothetical protein